MIPDQEQPTMVFLPFATPKELANHLVAFVRGCQNPSPGGFSAYRTREGLGVSCTSENAKTLPYRKARIDQNTLVLSSGQRFTVTKQHHHLNMLELLALAVTDRDTSLRDGSREDILILFNSRAELREALYRLIRAGCDSRISWARIEPLKQKNYCLKVNGIPCYERLTLADRAAAVNYSTADASASAAIRLFRKQVGAKGCSVYLPFAADYPALEKILPFLRISNGTSLVYDGVSFRTLPTEACFCHLYDDQALFSPTLTVEQIRGKLPGEWEPIRIELELRQRANCREDDGRKSHIWLLSLKELEVLKKQLNSTPESSLEDLDGAVIDADGEPVLVLRARKQTQVYHAMFSEGAEVFCEWLPGRNASVIFLPKGFDLFPSLRRESYLQALGVNDLSGQIILLRQGAEKTRLLFFPEQHLQPFRATLVHYSATLHSQSIKNLIDRTILDLQPLEDFEEPQGNRAIRPDADRNIPDGADVQPNPAIALQGEVPGANRLSKYLDGGGFIEEPLLQGRDANRPMDVQSKGHKPSMTAASVEARQYNELRSTCHHLVEKALAAQKSRPDAADAALTPREWQELFTLSVIFYSARIQAMPVEFINQLYAGKANLLDHTWDALCDDHDLAAAFNALCLVADPYFSVEISPSRIWRSMTKTGGDNRQLCLLQHLIEQALLLSVLPPEEWEECREAVAGIAGLAVNRHVKVLKVLHRIYESSWQQLVREIIEDYEGCSNERWLAAYRLVLDQRILSSEEEVVLAAKLVFDRDAAGAEAVLAERLTKGLGLNPEELSEALSSRNPLPERVLALYRNSCCLNRPISERLLARVTELDREVASLEDLRLHWLYAQAVYRLNQDDTLRDPIRVRIHERIKNRQGKGLAPPFVQQSIAERARANELLLMAQGSVDLFAEQDRVLSFWIRLMDAWKRVLKSPKSLGVLPDCSREPDCRRCRTPRESQRGILCTLKKKILGHDNTGASLPVAVFRAFLTMIEQQSCGVFTASSDESRKDATGIDNQREVNDLAQYRLNQANHFQSRPPHAGEGPSILDEPNWLDDGDTSLALVATLLSDNPEEDFISKSAPELLPLCASPPAARRLELINYVPYWYEMGLKDVSMAVIDGLTRAVDDLLREKHSDVVVMGEGAVALNPAEARLLAGFVAALLAAGEIEQALLHAEAFLNAVIAVNLPAESRSRLVAPLVSRIACGFRRLTTGEMLQYRQRIRDLFQNATCLRDTSMDFTIVSPGRLELIEALCDIFTLHGADDEITEIERVTAVELKKLLKRISRDCANL